MGTTEISDIEFLQHPPPQKKIESVVDFTINFQGFFLFFHQFDHGGIPS